MSMSDFPESGPGPDVLGTAQKLAGLLKGDPQGLDRETYQNGDQLLTFFQDSNYGAGFRNLNAFKIEAVMQAIDDLAGRAKYLTTSYIGVAFSKGKLSTYISPLGESPEGNVVYKIGLKDVAAFQKWRTGQNNEVTPEDINSAIYRLTVEWSRLL